MLSLIWAQNAQGVIGVDNTLPWHCPEDLMYFKSVTRGNTVIMGYNTWKSLPVKPLRDRHNIVVVSRELSQLPGISALEDYDNVEVSSHFDHVMFELVQMGKSAFCIGGGQLYKEALPYANVLHVTEIDHPLTLSDYSKVVFAPKLGEDWVVDSEVRIAPNAVVKRYIRSENKTA